MNFFTTRFTRVSSGPGTALCLGVVQLPTVLMSPSESSPKHNQPVRHGRAMITFALATVMSFWVGWDNAEDWYVVPMEPPVQGELDSNAVVLAFTNGAPSAAAHAETMDVVGVQLSHTETCRGENTVLSLLELPGASIDLLSFLSAPPTGRDLLDSLEVTLASVRTSGVDLVSYARRKILPKFTSAYRAVLKRVTIMELPRILYEAALAHSTIVGTASTYNPYRDGKEEGGAQTASGELYDPTAWTAAIKTDLRNQFGGIRYGNLYQPAFALVESGDKQLIVKINDVGPLRPGRVLDLNERSMRYFDPFLTRGLIQNAKITVLPGEDWTPGPVRGRYAIDFSGSEWRAALEPFGSIDLTSWQMVSELARLRAPSAPAPYPPGIEDVRAEMRPSEGG